MPAYFDRTRELSKEEWYPEPPPRRTMSISINADFYHHPLLHNPIHPAGNDGGNRRDATEGRRKRKISHKYDSRLVKKKTAGLPSLRYSITNHASFIYSDLYTTKHEIPPLLQSDCFNNEGAPSLPVLVTNSPRTIEQWLSTHCGTDAVLGFDTESMAKAVWFSERAILLDGPSTVQLSTVDSCLIVHLTRYGDGTAPYAPEALRAVRNDSTLVKAGVGIDADAIELYRLG